MRHNRHGSAIISGSGSLVQAGKGTLRLSGSSSYSGGTTISARTLQIGNGGTGGALGAGAVTVDTALVFNLSRAEAFAGDIGGTGSLIHVGSGTLVLGGSNWYGGGTFVTNGTLVVTNPEALVDGSNLYVGSDLSAFGVEFATVVADGSAVAVGSGLNEVVPVPEPGTLAILAAVLWASLVCRRMG